MTSPATLVPAFRTLTPAEVSLMTGLEQLRAILAGTIPSPSMGDTLRFRLVEADEGYAAFEGEPGPFALNPMGTVHGGYVATLLDSVLGCAVHSTLAVGGAYGTVDLGVKMVRALTPDVGRVRAEARVVHRGRTLATADGRVFRLSDGALVAQGNTTCMILR